jgi:hypothetical protein
MGIALDVNRLKKVAFSLCAILGDSDYPSGGVLGDGARRLNDCTIAVLAAGYSGACIRAAPGLSH